MSDDIVATSPETMETLEHYAAALLMSMISIRTLEAYQIAAYKKGLLSDDQAEVSKTICWELRRCMSLYKTQFEDVATKVDVDEVKIRSCLLTLLNKQDETKTND